MDLEKLIFHVDTKALDDADKKIDALTQKVSGLNKPFQNLSKSAKDAGSSVEETAKKTKKLADSTDEAEEKLTKAEKAVKKYQDQLAVLFNMEVQAADGAVRLGEGLTRGQASQLASAKAMGATIEQLKTITEVFDQINKTSGKNTFDKSTQNLSRMRQEVQEMQSVNDLMGKGFALTRDQVVGLSRDLARLTEVAKQEGTAGNDLNLILEKTIKETVELSRKKNELTAATKAAEDAAKAEAKALVENQNAYRASFDNRMKWNQLREEQEKTTSKAILGEMAAMYREEERLANQANKATSSKYIPDDSHVTQFYAVQAKAAKESGKATEYVTRELDKLTFAHDNLKNELTKGSSNAIFRFEQNLKKSTLSIEEQTTALARFKAMTKEMQKVHNANQVDYLSRALGPQITDVFVGLATGQSPLMVLLQQGGQLRDQFALAGVAGANMGKMLTEAAAVMVVSVKDVAIAVGGLLVNSFVGAGKAIVNTANNLTGFNYLLDFTKTKVAETFGVNAANILTRFLGVVGSVAGAVTGGLLVALTGAAVATYKFTSAADDFIRTSAMQGNSLYMNKTQLEDYTESMRDLGVTAMQTTAVLTEMSKLNIFKKEDVATIAQFAVSLEKLAGVPIADTIKQYADIKKNPAESLIQVAKTTGQISIETQNYIQKLVEQGRTTQAVIEITQALKNSHIEAIDKMKSDLSPLAKMWIDFKESLSEVADTFVKIGQSPFMGKIVEQVQFAIDTLKFAAGLIDRMSPKVAAEGSFGLTPEQIELNKKNAAISDAAYKAKEESLSKEAKLQQDILMYSNKLTEALQNNNTIAAQGFAARIKDLQSQSIVGDLTLQQLKERIDLTNAGRDGEIEALQYRKELIQYGETELSNRQIINRVRDIELERSVDSIKLMQAEIALLSTRKDTELSIAVLRSKIKLEELKQLEIINAAGRKNRLEELAAIEQVKKGRLEAFAAELKANEDLRDAADERARNILLSQVEELRTLDEANSLLNLELNTLGLISEERKKILERKKIELKYEKEIREIRGKALNPAEEATAIRFAANIRDKALENLEKGFELEKKSKFIDSISEAITEALFTGGKDGAKKIREAIIKELQKPVRIFVQATISDLLKGGINGLSGGGIFKDLFGANIEGGVNTIADKLILNTEGAFQDFGWMLKDSANTIGQFSKTVGQIGGYLSAADAAANGQWGQAAGTAIGTYFGGPIGAAIGNTVGKFVDSLFGGGGGEKSTTGYGYGINQRDLGGGIGGAAEQYALGLTRQFAGIVGSLGGTSRLSTGAMWSTDPKGDAQTILQVAGAINGNEVYARSNRGLGGHNGIENVGRSEAELQAALSEEAQRLLLAGLKASDIGPEYKALIATTDAYTSSIEDVQAALTRVTAAGNIQERIYQLTATDSEKLARARQQEKDATDAMLIPMLDRLYALEDEKKILDERKSLEEELIRATGNLAGIRAMELSKLNESNRALQIQIWANEDAKKILDERAGIENRLLQLQGKTNELRARELEKLDASNRILQLRVWLIESENAVKAAQDKIESIRDTATSNYLSALEKVNGVQKSIADNAVEVANRFKDLAQSLREFIAQAKDPKKVFSDYVARALTGDEKAISGLSGVAQTAIDQSKGQSATLADYLFNKQSILNQVEAVAAYAESRAVGAKEKDPLVQLQEDLLKAQTELAEAQRVANAIGAPLVAKTDVLIGQYTEAVAELARANSELAWVQQSLGLVVTNTGATAANTQSTASRIAGLMDTILGSFNKIDTSLDGLLTFDEIKVALGDKASADDIKTIIASLDANKDGVISRLELINQGIAQVNTSVSGVGAVIGLNKPVEFAANDPIRSVFENINRTNKILLEQFKKSLEFSSGSNVSYDAASGTLFVDPLGGFMTSTNRSGGSAGFAGTYALQYDSTNYLMQINTTMASVLARLANIDVNTFNTNQAANLIAYVQQMVAFGGYSWLVRGFGPGQSIVVSSNNQTGTPSYFAKGGAFTNSVVSRPTAFNVMGEAGPEAVMPLKKMRDGSLGIRSEFGSAQPVDNSGVERRLASLEATLENALFQVAKNTKRTSDKLEQFDRDGMPATRT